MDFKITSEYKPTGDQPQAIRQLTEGIEQGEPAQVLLDLLVERQCGMNVDDLRHIRSTSAFPQPPSGGG